MALGIKPMTKTEVVASLRAQGFHAFERDWALGETIGVASDPSVGSGGITVYRRIVYIVRQGHDWVIEEISRFLRRELLVSR